jgi:hypothetical protein
MHSCTRSIHSVAHLPIIRPEAIHEIHLHPSFSPLLTFTISHRSALVLFWTLGNPSCPAPRPQDSRLMASNRPAVIAVTVWFSSFDPC